MSTKHVAVLVLLGIAAAVAVIDWTGEDADPTFEEGIASSRQGNGESLVGSRAASPDRSGETNTDSIGKDTPKERLIPMAERRATMLAQIADLGIAFGREREMERSETEEEEQIREAAWSRMVEGLVEKVRAHPGLADAMVAEMDQTRDEALAVRLARILRRAEHPELIESMQARVTKGATAMQRRTALLTLEMKDAEVWMDPVSQAYRGDADASVRAEAGGFLARSLADRKHLAVHNQMRETIQSGLDAKEPETKILALRTMLGDRRPRPQDLERAKAMLEDEHEGVQAEARRTIRVLGPILERALKARSKR